MPRSLGLLGLALLSLAGCQPDDAPVGELPRAGMKPILTVNPVYARAGFSATLEQDATLKTLEASRASYLEAWNALTPETSPSEYRAKYAEYVKAMRAIDVKDADLEFRAAWKRYLDAWDKLLAELRATPDGVYKDVEFMEALHAAFGVGGRDANRGLSSDAITAAEKLKDSLKKVYTAAELAGVNGQSSL